MFVQPSQMMIAVSPLKFMQWPPALLLRSRLHRIRFQGILAPHAKLRAAVVPGTVEKPSGHRATDRWTGAH